MDIQFQSNERSPSDGLKWAIISHFFAIHLNGAEMFATENIISVIQISIHLEGDYISKTYKIA